MIVGDTWTPPELRTVFAIGVGLSLPSFWLLYSFNDDLMLQPDTQEESKKQAEAIDSQEDSAETRDNALSENNGLDEPLLQSDKQSQRSEKELAAAYWIPRIIVGTDLMAGFASGMTIKFFPLFFKEESQMSPIEVNIVLFFAYFFVSLFSYFARLSAERLGRVNTLLLFQVSGSLLLTSMYAMSIGHDLKEPGQVPSWRNKLFIAPIYLTRTALMNATRPIKRAMLMENVPRNERGVWSAFESLRRFGWSGSAIVGGFLMDKYGYGVTFLATSLIQLTYSLLNGLLKIYTD